MALIIDSLPTLNRSTRRKLRRFSSRLGDDYLIRSPVFDDKRVADLFIEGPNNNWLLLGFHSFKPLEDELGKYLSFSLILKQTYSAHLNYLAITEQGASLLDSSASKLKNLYTMEANRFFDEGEMTLAELMRPICSECSDWIRKNFFPVANICPEITTRANFKSRNSSATAKNYFLDYKQEEAAMLDMFQLQTDDNEELDDEHNQDYSVRLINGVAGSGKTLILINRALTYCKKYPERQVILLIHNKPITSDIEFKVEHYLKGKPDNLTIRTFHSFALAQQRIARAYVTPLFNATKLEKLKDKVLNCSEAKDIRTQLNLSEDQLWSELEYINEHLIIDQEAYLVLDRQGRGFALQRNQRELLWQLYEQGRVYMANSRGYLPSLYIRELCLMGSCHERLMQYDHMLLDEAQFFAPSWFSLVLKSLRPGGQLFICADPNQGFLRNRLSWKGVGLDVRGRTKRLSYSYRTTYEILMAANSLLENLKENSDDFIKPDLENMNRGEKPVLIRSDSPQDEEIRFLNELLSLIETYKIPLNHILVLCSDAVNPWSLKKSIESRLGHNSVTNYLDKNDLKGRSSDCIKLMTINSCTGMEAGITFVLGVGELLEWSRNLDFDENESQLAFEESVRKLYVAMTRAGQKLLLFSTSDLPENTMKYLDIGNSD